MGNLVWPIPQIPSFHVFGLWEEARGPGENPHSHREAVGHKIQPSGVDSSTPGCLWCSTALHDSVCNSCLICLFLEKCFHTESFSLLIVGSSLPLRSAIIHTFFFSGTTQTVDWILPLALRYLTGFNHTTCPLFNSMSIFIFKPRIKES